MRPDAAVDSSAAVVVGSSVAVVAAGSSAAIVAAGSSVADVAAGDRTSAGGPPAAADDAECHEC